MNILMSNYTNKHIMFNKGEEYVGHLEPPIEEYHNLKQIQKHQQHTCITTERGMAKQVEPDTFKPPHDKLKPNNETKLT